MKKLAIVGSGIAGMGCAHLLHKKYDIHVFEKDNYPGGHTNTIVCSEEKGAVYIDTGFMVFNFVTYPLLHKLFKEIGAPIVKTDMSFSVQYLSTALEYCGSGINGLFAQRKNLLNTRYIKMLAEIARFNKLSVEILDKPEFETLNLQDYITKFGFSADMYHKYLVPMSSAVWSTPPEKMADFPARSLIQFFKNHGFLGLNTQHQWYTLQNGSQAYRELLIAPFREKIRTNKWVKKVSVKDGTCRINFADRSEEDFDKVILACHADQALSVLESPDELQNTLLSKFRYQKNTATVHTDESVMPKTKRAWSSWNYRVEEIDGKILPSTIYWMNRLQKVSKTKNYFVSINAPANNISKEKIVREIDYEHPLFDVGAVQAQKDLWKLNKNGPLYFCGSYFGYGFHEDAYRSAVELSQNM